MNFLSNPQVLRKQSLRASFSRALQATPSLNITANEDLFSTPYYCYILLRMQFHLSHASGLVPALFENPLNDVPAICWCELVKHTYMDPLSYHNPRMEIQSILRMIPQQFPGPGPPIRVANIGIESLYH